MTGAEKNSRAGFTIKYDVVARAFTVIDVATPIKHYAKPKETLKHVYEKIVDEWFIVVRDERKIYGYLALDDDAFMAPITGTAQSRSTQVSPDMIVSGEMPLLDLVPLFESKYFYFVLTKNNITHVVSFNDLDSIPMKLCLFSLFMELEEALLQLLTADGKKTEAYLKVLPINRLIKAQELAKLKSKHSGFEKEVGPARTIYCTTFIDKVTMLAKSGTHERLGFQSKNKFRDFFVMVEKARNQIAHGESILGLFGKPGDMQGLISELKRVLATSQRK